MTAGLIEALIGSTAVALLLGGAAFCVDARARNPGVAHALYLLALLKLVTPPLWTVAAVTLPAEPSPVARPAERAAIAAPVASAPPAATGAAAEPATAPRAPFAADELLFALWLAGSAGVVLLMVRRAAAFRAAVRATSAAPPAWQREARDLLPAAGLTALPALDVTGALVSPLVYPTFGGLRILLPRALLERLTPVQRQALILHELVHVRRGDPWVRALEVAVIVGLWWHPLAWWLRAGLRDAEEKCCDAWVTAALPGGRRAYADAVLSVAAGLAHTRSPIPAHATGAVRLRAWKKRLRCIMSDDVRKTMGWRAKLAVLALAGIALPLLPTVAQQEPRPAGGAAAEEQAKILQALETKPVRVRLARVTLDDWVTALSRAIGLELTVTEAARKAAADKSDLGDVDLPEMSARKALDVVATVLEVTWAVSRDNRIVIDAPAPAVQVIGEVLRPGWVALRDVDTVLELIARADPTEAADIEHVLLIRRDGASPLTLEIDVRQMLLTGNPTYNVQLGPRDLMVVPARPGAAARVGLGKPERLGIGDAVVFFLEPSILEQPGFGLLKILTEPQVVGHDGTILIPYVGRVSGLGLTEAEVEALVTQKLAEYYQVKLTLHARFSDSARALPR